MSKLLAIQPIVFQWLYTLHILSKQQKHLKVVYNEDSSKKSTNLITIWTVSMDFNNYNKTYSGFKFLTLKGIERYYTRSYNNYMACCCKQKIFLETRNFHWQIYLMQVTLSPQKTTTTTNYRPRGRLVFTYINLWRNTRPEGKTKI